MAVEARIEVSVWLKEREVIVSTEFGQLRVWIGLLPGRERSYMWTVEAEAAKFGRLRWCVMDVKVLAPKYSPSGVD